jgi:autotransporter-associated beta strand protein
VVFTLAVALVSALPAVPLRAAVTTWQVDADGNWFTPGNWSGGVPVNTSDATFGNVTAVRTITLDMSSPIAGALLFNTAGATGYTFTAASPQTLTLSGLGATPGVVMSQNGYGDIVFNPNAQISLGGTAATFNGTGFGRVLLNSTITNSAPLTFSGRAKYVLGADNTATLTAGTQFVVDGGRLEISADNQLGAIPGAFDPSFLTLRNAGEFTTNGTFTLNANRGITVDTVAGGALRTATGTLTYGGVITGAATTTFSKTGAGTLELTGVNTLAGNLVVDKGTLSFSGAGSMLNTAGITVQNRAALTLDNTASPIDRIAGPLTSRGGILNFTGHATTATAQSAGILNLNAGALTINSSAGTGGNTLTFSSLNRSAGGTLFATGTGLGGASNQVVFTTAPTLQNSVLPYAVVSDGTLTSLATHGGNGTTLAPLDLAGHNQGAIGTWVAASNARPTADQTAAGNLLLNSLTLDNGIDLLGPAGDRTLTIGGTQGGAVLQTGGSSIIAANTTNEYILAFGTNEAIFHTIGNLTIQRGNTNILTGSGGMTKSGAGILEVNVANAITGVLRINEGTYRAVNGTTALGAGSVEMNGGTIDLRADAAVAFGRAITLNADGTILISRLAPGAGVTHTNTTLTMAAGRTLTVAAGANINADTAYGLSFITAGSVLQGTSTFHIDNNGTGVGTINMNTMSGAFPITKTGTGDLISTSTTASFSGPIDVQAGRIGWNFATTTVNHADSISGLGGIIKSGTGIVNVAGNVSLGGTVRNVAGTLNLNGANQVGGDLVLIAGALSLNGPNVIGGNIAVTAGTLNLTGTTYLGGTITQTAGTVNLSGQNNNIVGAITIASGIFGFSSLGSSTAALNITTGTLSFLGSTNQTVVRPITLGGALTLNTAGTAGATVNYSTALANMGATSLTLTGNNTSFGVISGGFTQTGTAVDLALNSGNWTLSGATATVADDVITTGAGTVLNLNTTNVLNYTAGASNGLYARGSTINLNANDVNGAANSGGLDFIFLSDTIGPSVFNTNTFNITTPRIDVGQFAPGLTADVLGTGTVTVTTSINLFRGLVTANLAGAGAIIKSSDGDLTLSGDNSGLTGGTAAIITGGRLILDYTTNNNAKLRDLTGLEMRGGGLLLNGNAAAPTTQSVASLLLSATNPGANKISLVSNGGQAITLNLGGITRAVGAGTVRFELPTAGGITTTTANATTGILGAYATVRDATGTYFARNDGSGNIAAQTGTVKNNVATWAAGDHVTDSGAGYTGTIGFPGVTINSLRFNAAGGSTVTVDPSAVLTIASGGILATDNVTGGPSTLTGGRLVASTGEVILTSDSPSQPLNVNSSIGGTQRVTIASEGTVSLGGRNYYSGITSIQSGTLRTSGGKGIGDLSTVSFTDDRNATLQLGADETIGNLVGGSGTAGQLFGIVDVGSNSLTIRSTANSTTYLGAFTGSGNIIKDGLNTNFLMTQVSSGFTGGLVVNGGLLYLEGIATTNASSVTVNKNGSFLISNNSATRSGVRLPDNAVINLNSADGAWNTFTRPSGLAIRTDTAAAVTSETVGVLNVLSGASYAQLESTNATAFTQLIVDNITRANRATFNVRGTNMAATTGSRAQLRIGTVPNETAFIGTMVGGGSTTLGTRNISITPWMIAEETASAVGVGDTNMGNSLATYAAGQGFRALNLTTEYNTYSAALAAENVRETLTADLTGLTGKTINSLVIHNNSTAASALNMTGSGVLDVTSGALLFTLNPTATASSAHSVTLGGFSGITVGSTNEYVFHVVNPSSVATTPTLSATIASALTSAADITKSGRGTLVLTAGNTAGGGANRTTLNEGVLQIGDLDNIGGATGNLVFAGGTLRLTSTFADDLSTRTISYLLGGGTLDTNGANLTLAGSLGSGVGGLTKIGTGDLTLNAASTYSGGTTLNAGNVIVNNGSAFGTGTLTLGGSNLQLNTATSVSGFQINANAAISGSGDFMVTGDIGQAGGNRTLTLSNAGTSTFGDAATDEFFLAEANQTRTLSIDVGASSAAVINATLLDGLGTGADGLTKLGAGSLTINNPNAYSGATTVDQGSIIFNADQTLGGGMVLGAAATSTNTSTVNFLNASANFTGGLTVQNNSVTASTFQIGASESVTFGGNVAFGSTTALSQTAVNFTGGGTLNIANLAAAATVSLGGTTSNRTFVDMTGLGTLNISLNTTDGIVRVNSTSGTNTANIFSELLLPSTVNITASQIAVGNGGTNNVSAGTPQINRLRLGSGVNTLRVNTVNIGTGSRDSGTIDFNTASGSLDLRAADGIGRANLNIGTGSAATGTIGENLLDLAGHQADLFLGTVSIGTQPRTGNLTNRVEFNQGTLDIQSLVMSTKASGATTTLSTINLSGGTTTIGTGSGQAILMGQNAGTGQAHAVINITGTAGVTITGDVVKGTNTGAGTSSGTIMLDGGTLDFTGKNVGSATDLINLDLQSGTLKNLGQLNGGTTALVKSTTGTLIVDGTNTYGGNTEIRAGTIVAVGGANNRLGSTGQLILGNGVDSGVLQLGTAAGASSQTFTGLSSSGTGTASAIVSGNAAFSTLTINQSFNSVYSGAVGGAGANQNNLNLIKSGSGALTLAGPNTATGTVAVNQGTLRIDTPGSLAATIAGLTVGDGAEFNLRGTSPSGHVNYGFSGTGNVATIGNSTGATLGFSLNGIYNSRLNLTTGQTLTVNGTLATKVEVFNAPTAGLDYILLNGADQNSLGLSGVFDTAPTIINGGSFTYALRRENNVSGDRWILTPTAMPALADVWWKGDLDGLGTGVWTATTPVGTGTPSNWASTQAGDIDAIVPPDSRSTVHFSATGAANFNTTIGGNLTIKALIFEAGATPISIGGPHTLTIGNGTDPSGLTMAAGAPNVLLTAPVAIGQSQSWNITDAASTLTIAGALGGTGNLGINDNGAATGTLIFSGANGAATYTGGTTIGAGRVILEGGVNDRLPVAGTLTLGAGTTSGILQLGDTVNGASNATVGGLATGGSGTANAVVGGATTNSTLTIAGAGNTVYSGLIGGAGANDNRINLVKRGTGVFTLNGAATHIGTTTIADGTLRMGAAGSIVGTPGLSIVGESGGHGRFDINGLNVTITPAITLGGADGTAAASIIDGVGGGVLTLGATLTYSATNNPLGAVVSANLASAASRSIVVGDSTNAAVDLTLNGTIAVTGGSLTFDGTGVTEVNGAASATGSGFDVVKAGTGTLTVNAAMTATDDVLINLGTVNAMASNALNATDDLVLVGNSIVNIGGSAGTSGVHQGDGFFIRTGSQVNVTVNNGISLGTNSVSVGDSASTGAAAGKLNLAANINIGAGGLIVGAAGGHTGNVFGTGSINTATSFALRIGSIGSGVDLAGTGAITKTVDSQFTFAGSHSGTGAVSVQQGELILDYTANNAGKVGGALNIGTLVGNQTGVTALTLNGSNSAATVETATTSTLTGWKATVSVNNGTGQTAVMDLGSIVRTQVGTWLDLNYSSTSAGAKTSLAATPALGWATVTTGGTTRLAAIDAGGNLVQAAMTTQNDVTEWVVGQNVINTGAFTGTVLNCNNIGSLTFDAATAATVNIGADRTLNISSGAIVVNASVGANDSTISGGAIAGATSGVLGELIVYQNNTAGRLVINSNIVGSGGITKNGLGTLVLGGDNTFTATAQVALNEGTLRLVGGRALGDTTTLNMRSGTTLEVAGNETIGSLGLSATNVAAGTIVLENDLTINQSTAASFIGAINGAGNLTKTGAATLTIGGAGGTTGTVTVSQGALILSGLGTLNAATGYVLNGAELRSAQNQATSQNRLSDTAGITLHNTAGTNGLTVENVDQAATRTENLGLITLGYGHNVITALATNNDPAAVADLLGDGLARGANRGTVVVRGLALGSSAVVRKGLIRFDSNANFSADIVGGGGAAGTQNISIVPWVIGDLASAGNGNTFATYQDATFGFRPLAAGEYTTDAAGYNALVGASTNNVRFTATATLTGTATAVNAIVIDSAAVATINGPAQALQITSGAILSAGGNVNRTLGGFTSITTGGGRDYTIYETSTGTFTINSALTSNVALVKSGQGTLALTNAGNAFTDVYLNQGTVQVDDLDKLGSGSLNFAGGGLRLTAAFADDLSTKTINVNPGNGTIDVGAVTAGVTLTNGIDAAGSSDRTLTFVTRAAAGTGQLIINGASTFTGTTIFNHTLVDNANNTSVLLNGTTNAAINGNLQIGSLGTITNNSADVVVSLGANEQIVDTAVISFRGTDQEFAYFKLLGRTETVAGISDSSTFGIISNREADVVGGAGTLILDSDDDYSFNGFFRDASGGAIEPVNKLLLTKLGTGTQTLIGVNVRHSGLTTISEGTLAIQDVTNWSADIANSSRLDIIQTTGTRTHSQAISGTGEVTKLGAGTLVLSGANSYAGRTVIEQGVLSFGTAAHLGDGSATNTVVIRNGATLRSTGTAVDLGAARGVEVAGSSAVIEVAPATRLTISGVVAGHDCTPLLKTGTGILTLAGANTYDGEVRVTAGGLEVNNSLAGSVLVQSTATLGGTGTIAGPVTLAAGSSFLQSGASSGTVATLGVGSLTIDAAALEFRLGSSLTRDMINVAGNLTLTGISNFNLNPTTFGAVTPGTYRLIQYGGTLTGGLANIATTSGSFSGYNYSLVFRAGGLDLDLAARTTRRWTGAGTAWVNNDAILNWHDGTAAAGFINTDAVLFNDTASSGTVVVDAAGVAPSSIEFDNATLAYVVSGGAITGTTGLTKNGAASVTLANSTANTFSGDVVINGGTLILGSTAANGAIRGDATASKVDADVIVNSGGTLHWKDGDQIHDDATIQVNAGGVVALVSSDFTGSNRHEKFYNLINNGGTYSSGRNFTVEIVDPTWSGTSTNTIEGTDIYGELVVRNTGINRVLGDSGTGFPASLTINAAGTDGLRFDGTAMASTLRLSSDATTGGRLNMNTNLAYSGTGPSASGIVNSVTTTATGVDNAGVFGAQLGVVDLGGAVRTFSIGDGVGTTTTTGLRGADFVVTARLTNGGINKQGAGELVVANTAGDYGFSGGITSGGGLLTMGGNIGTSGSTFLLASGGGFSAGASVVTTGNIQTATSAIGTADFQNTGADSSVWAGNSTLVFQFKNVASDGVTGAGTEWDLINNNLGTLLITADTVNKITLLVESFSDLTTLGQAANFNPGTTTAYSWKFATNVNDAGAAAKFAVDERGVWTNSSFTGGYGSFDHFTGGGFGVTMVGTDLYLTYSSSAIPEPGSFLLAGLAAALGYRRFKKRGKGNGDGGAANTPVAETQAPVDVA